MINKLRKRFVILGTASIFALLVILISFINITSYSKLIFEIDKTIDVLMQADIRDFDIRNNDIQKKPKEFKKEFQKLLPRGMSIEVPFESRYFIVEANSDGVITNKDLRRIAVLDDETIDKYTQIAIKNDKQIGFINDYRYKKTVDDSLIKILFFDCGRKLETYHNFMFISIVIGIMGLFSSFVIFILVSKKVVNPIASSYEKQKRFITDAGHEIKTPLTIISVNTDLLENDYGNNEPINDIKEQVNRLKNLTNDLVYLSSVDELSMITRKNKISFSIIVKHKIDEFKSLISRKKIKLNYEIKEDILINGDQNEIDKLVSIIIENAIKYTKKSGEININLINNKKYAILEVKNSFKQSYNKEQLKNIFERFYRIDASRNSETGGSGIGLSIAKAIVDSHKGNISADINDGYFVILVKLNIV